MSKNKLWGIDTQDNKPIKVCLFVSRKKDNEYIGNFIERRKSFITTKTKDELIEEFDNFVSHGVEGELCRMYLSVNARDGKKIYKELLHFLVDNPDFNLTHINSKLASIAAKKECALEKKWMFDFDLDNDEMELQFETDIINTSVPVVNKIENYDTPHGYAIIVDHGFDTRQLMEEWGNVVTLKRDDLLCVAWDWTHFRKE